MILHIDDSQSISNLQEHFSKCFPLLKIEFYDKELDCQEPCWDEHKFPPETKIGSIRKIHEQGDLVVMSGDTTGQVKRAIRQQFGFNIQIFRNENDLWVQTALPDDLTLKEHYELAVKASRPKVDAQSQSELYDPLLEIQGMIHDEDN